MNAHPVALPRPPVAPRSMSPRAGLGGVLPLLLALTALLVPPGRVAADDFKDQFDLGSRTLADSGRSRYFVLEPGFQSVLESKKGRVVITVLDETRMVGGVRTRVVEEREEKQGKLYEVSRNFYAIDPATGDVFYFGEEVDFYKNGKIVRHTGAWRADEQGNRPGMIMPGVPTVGMKYYQELAPGVAMDRAEVLEVSATFETPAGRFTECLRTRESSKIKLLRFIPISERKTYAPGIGLIQDEDLLLVRHGRIEAGGAR